MIIIVRIVDTIAATVMGKKEDLRAAKRVAKAKLSPKPKEQRARRRADQARKGARALQRAENLAQQLAQVLPTSAVATRAVASSLASAAATATTFPCITSPWQLGNIVKCDVSGELFTVLLSALRPVGWVVDPEYEALMASKLIESNRNRFVEEPSGQCGAASVGRQASDNRSASDAEHVRFARRGRRSVPKAVREPIVIVGNVTDRSFFERRSMELT